MKNFSLTIALFSTISLFAQNNEVMEISKMQLFKGPMASTTVVELNKHFAKVDSIVDAGDEDCAFYTNETDTFERYYYSGITYMAKNKGKAFLYEVDFNISGIEITCENISLSRETTFIQFVKVYRGPNMKTTKKGKTVEVYVSYESDDRWQLTFVNSKLVSLKYLSDC